MSKAIRSLLGMLTLILAFQVSFAQNRVITGTVKDQSGESIIGASVLVKGTTTGTYTDVDGNFSLAVPANSTALVFKYLGYKAKEVPIAASNVINISLDEDVLGLEEVVVTALGITREKKAIGYSAQSVDGDQLTNSSSSNPLSELNGKVSGLTIINSNGDPGGGTYVRLRGVTSITGSNAPLIIVDGIPLDNSINMYDPTNVGFQAGGPTSGAAGNAVGGVSPDNRGVDINPNDIASVTVLKGPAATALYGLQAASGALIITTKKGSGSPDHRGPTLSFTSSYSNEVVNKFPDLQNKYAAGTGLDNGFNFIDPTWISADGLLGDGTPAPGSLAGNQKFSWGPLIDTLSWTGIPNDYDQNGRIVSSNSPLAAYPVTPYDNLRNFYTTGSTADNNLSISGGNETSGYRLSIGNNEQKGVVPQTDYIKSVFSLSGQTTISNKFRTAGSISYIKSGGRKAQAGSNVSGIMLGLLRTPPTFDDANGNADPANSPSSYLLPDGTQRDFRGGPGYDNPYWTVNRNPFDESINRVYGFGEVDYTPFTWMNWTYRVGGDVYAQSNTNGFDIGSNAVTEGILIQDDYFNKQFNSDLILTLHKDFGKDFTAQLIVGHNYFTSSITQHWAQGDGFTLPNFFSMANASSFLAKRISSEKRTMAFYGDLSLGFKDQVFLDLTGRDETTSTLPAESNNFFFPSATLSWVFTDAFGLATSNVFPYGKIRVSAANVGKDAPSQALQTYYVSSVVADGFTTGDLLPFNGVAGYQLSNLTQVVGDANLKPERTNSYEGGIDLSFFRNRLGFSGTYYYEKTEDQIFTVPLAPSTGFAAAILNAGSIKNTGVELTLNITPIKTKDNFRWDLSFNWSTNKNEVVSLYPGVQRILIGGFGGGETEVDAAAGEPFGVLYGTDFVKDPNGQIVLDDNPLDSLFGYAQPILGDESVKIGDINPDWNGSVQSTFSYKGVSLGFQIDIREGGDIWNGTRGALAYFGTAGETADRNTTTTFEGVLGHLDADGNLVHFGPDGTELPGAGATNTIQSSLNQYYWQFIGNSFTSAQSIDIEDGSFIKLRQITLGYDFPKKLISNLKLSSLSVSVFASNIILNTDYKGVDPESNLIGPANGQGLDYFNNPGVSSYGIKLNLGL